MVGSGELLIILVVILILFGGKKLPEFAQSLGKGIREFKKACYGEEEQSNFNSSSEVPPHSHKLPDSSDSKNHTLTK